MDRNYMFICGCPRSGTTALHELVSHAPEVACGIERYHRRLLRDDALRKEHFEKERFFQAVEDDTFYLDPLNCKFEEFYRELMERYDQARLFGDKIPTLFRRYDSIHREFGRPKLIFIYRNVFDVCLSYNQRLMNPEDNWSVQPEQGIKDWNQSLMTTFRALEAGADLLTVSYEELFVSKSEDLVERIFHFLGVPVPDSIMQTGVMSRRVETFGPQADSHPLTPEQKLLISMTANTGALKRLHERAVPSGPVSDPTKATAP